MKNSRRSDRELAKAVGVSQPTISRMIKKLEKEGYIKEYTIIPDFEKLGYNLLGFTLVKQHHVDDEKLKEVKKTTAELERRNPFAKITVVHGMGLGKDLLFATFYKDYAEFVKSMDHIKTMPVTDIDTIETFLVNISDPRNSRLLSMSKVANHSIALHKEEGNEPRTPLR
jgi:DNA-binding Lrp family transcriptional regulator